MRIDSNFEDERKIAQMVLDAWADYDSLVQKRLLPSLEVSDADGRGRILLCGLARSVHELIGGLALLVREMPDQSAERASSPVVRAVYDLTYQSRYICLDPGDFVTLPKKLVADAMTPDEKVDLFLDHAVRVGRARCDAVRNSPSELASWLVESQLFRDYESIFTTTADPAESVPGAFTQWYGGSLRDLAARLQTEDEYRILVSELNQFVHGSGLTHYTRPLLCGPYKLICAITLSASQLLAVQQPLGLRYEHAVRRKLEGWNRNFWSDLSKDLSDDGYLSSPGD